MKAELDARRGVDIVVDCLGGDTVGECLPYLNCWGRWIMIAAIVFGVFAGLYSMFHFLLTAARTMDPTAPPSSDVPSSHKKEDDPHGTR